MVHGGASLGSNMSAGTRFASDWLLPMHVDELEAGRDLAPCYPKRLMARCAVDLSKDDLARRYRLTWMPTAWRHFQAAAWHST